MGIHLKCKKGFTLVELLAVIVILAIIMVIAVPKILDVIENSRRSAAVDSAYGYIEAIKYNNSMNIVNNKKYSKIDSGNVTEINSKVNLKGTRPTSGTVTIEKGRVKEAELCISGYNVVYSSNKVSVIGLCEGTGGVEKGPTEVIPTNEETYKAIIYLDPTDLTKKCNATNAVSTTGTKTGCMKFYAFQETATTYDLILDHNTTATVQWNSSGNNSTGMKEVKEALEADTANWKLKARLITADEVAKITKADEILEWTSDKTYSSVPRKGYSISWFVLDGADGTDSIWQSQVVSSQGASKYDWLFDNTNGCISYGCSIQDSSNNGYWTSTPVAGYSPSAWRVDSKADFGGYDIYRNDVVGVRPVISVEKSLIS